MLVSVTHSMVFKETMCIGLLQTDSLAGNMGLPMAQRIAKEYQLVRSCYHPGESYQ